MIEFSSLPQLLSRYSLSSKIQACYSVSSTLATAIDEPTVDELRIIQPWHLETFLMLSLLCKEHGNVDILQHESQCLNKILDCISRYVSKKIKDSSGFDVHKFLSVTGLSQFRWQIDPYHQYYRYTYFFNYNKSGCDLSSRFRELFGVDVSTYIRAC